MDGLTIRHHPGTLTTGEIADLANLAGVLRAKSQKYADLISNWTRQEIERRDQFEGEPLEPRLCQVAAVKWTDSELSDALTAAIVGLKVVGHESSPRVRAIIADIAITIGAWTSSRLERKQSI